MGSAIMSANILIHADLVNTFPNKKECPEYWFCISPAWRPTEVHIRIYASFVYSLSAYTIHVLCTEMEVTEIILEKVSRFCQLLSHSRGFLSSL